MRTPRRTVRFLGPDLAALLLPAVLALLAIAGAPLDPMSLSERWIGLVALAVGGAVVVWRLGPEGPREVDPRPRELMEGFAKLGNADFSTRVPVRGSDEMAQVAWAFNELVARLGAAVEEMRYSRDYFEGIVENSADIIVTVNPHGYIYTFNRGAEQVLGWSRDEMIGRHVSKIFADPSERDAAVAQLREAEDVVNHETRVITKDGQVREVLLTLSRLRDAGGKTIGSFGIAKDMTEVNRMHRRLLESERFAAIGQALAGIQHALKNILNAMRGGAYMVKLGLSKDDRPLLEEGWAMVRDGIENATSMSTHMLRYLKEWKPEFSRVDLASMVREIGGALSATARDKKVRLSVDAPPGPLLVLCDARLIHSALMDILTNALDACLEKRYEGDEEPEVRMRAALTESRSTVVLGVRDNGCGMTEEVRRNVFAPFFSTKKSKGTGLGLALTARTIRLHGGEIEVESKPDRGTEFRIVVPVEGPSGAKEMPDEQEGADRR
ncbi:MAG: PAS domain S-box protein [Planctomycetes bacterium]|jgi:PAS domain S-box-containing protein|nr:PAS domain S-box protein [Planctomycetota bacterium]